MTFGWIRQVSGAEMYPNGTFWRGDRGFTGEGIWLRHSQWLGGGENPELSVHDLKKNV